MYPILIDWGPFQLHTYALTLAIGFMAAFHYANNQVEKRGIDLNKVLNLEVVLIASSLLGSRLMFVVVEWDYFATNPGEILMFWRGGMVYYGGFLSALIACLWYAWYIQLPWLTCADIAAPSIVIGQFFGRMGCLAGACCFGKPTDLPWGLVFPGVLPIGTARHPTQIYEMMAVLVIFALLHWCLQREKRVPGTVMVMYGYLYALARFGIEFLRGDDRGDFYFQIFSVSQVVSMAVVVVAILAHVYLAKRASPPLPES